MLIAYSLAIFTGAALLFMVQPLFAKVLLPSLGGSPAVWNTCMVFYQAGLLLGYLYADRSVKWFSPKLQVALHLVLLAAAAWMLPFPHSVGGPGPGQSPNVWLLSMLAATVGLPFLVVSATSPLLQAWFSRLGHARSADPYFLAVASNAGSFIGLLAYPLLVEPSLTRAQQSVLWMGGFGVFFLMMLVCMTLVGLSRKGAKSPEMPAANKGESLGGLKVRHPEVPGADAALQVLGFEPTPRLRLYWVLLALVPSSLMLGVTQYITTDVAAVPLLWALPLMLYLLTFMLAFSPRIRVGSAALARLAPFLVLGMLVLLLWAPRMYLLPVASAHLLTFFLLAWMCHKKMAELRPSPEHLTGFYLMMSVGGVLGGAFNALLAPRIFPAVIEYPLMLGAACLVVGGVWSGSFRREWMDRPAARVALGCVAFVLVMAAVIAVEMLISQGRFTGKGPMLAARAGVACGLCALLLWALGARIFAAGATAALALSVFTGSQGVIYQSRTFFGVHRVYATNQYGTTRLSLHHGTTRHGMQIRPDLNTTMPATNSQEQRDLLFGDRMSKGDAWRQERLRLLPTAYYAANGPAGDLCRVLLEEGRLKDIAVMGMGAGTMAAYAMEGTTLVFFEIDPDVVRLAQGTQSRDPVFTFIEDAGRRGGRVGTVVGDGRLTIIAPEVGPFDLIAVDAFSSDAIPAHLVTLEAVKAYVDRLKPGGVLLMHISNRHFDLAPVLARIGKELNLASYIRNDRAADLTNEERAEGKLDSTWVALVRTPADMRGLDAMDSGRRWVRMDAAETDPLWTDDFTNVLGVFRGW